MITGVASETQTGAAERRLLNERQAAAMLGLSVATLRGWRIRGGPIPFVKLGQRVLYDPLDIETAIAAAKRQSTSDPGPEGGYCDD